MRPIRFVTAFVVALMALASPVAASTCDTAALVLKEGRTVTVDVPAGVVTLTLTNDMSSRSFGTGTVGDYGTVEFPAEPGSSVEFTFTHAGGGVPLTANDGSKFSGCYEITVAPPETTTTTTTTTAPEPPPVTTTTVVTPEDTTTTTAAPPEQDELRTADVWIACPPNPGDRFDVIVAANGTFEVAELQLTYEDGTPVGGVIELTTEWESIEAGPQKVVEVTSTGRRIVATVTMDELVDTFTSYGICQPETTDTTVVDNPTGDDSSVTDEEILPVTGLSMGAIGAIGAALLLVGWAVELRTRPRPDRG